MKNSTKLILVTTVLGTFSLGALVKVVQADQLKPQVAEVSDGDGEINDDATLVLNSNKISQAQAMPSNNTSTEKAEIVMRKKTTT